MPDRSVSVEIPRDVPLPEWVLLQGFFVYFDADPRTFGYGQVAINDPGWFIHNIKDGLIPDPSSFFQHFGKLAESKLRNKKSGTADFEDIERRFEEEGR